MIIHQRYRVFFKQRYFSIFILGERKYKFYKDMFFFVFCMYESFIHFVVLRAGSHLFLEMYILRILFFWCYICECFQLILCVFFCCWRTHEIIHKMMAFIFFPFHRIELIYYYFWVGGGYWDNNNNNMYNWMCTGVLLCVFYLNKIVILHFISKCFFVCLCVCVCWGDCNE